MEDSIAIIIEKLADLETSVVSKPFYKKLEFWISTIIGLFSVFFSWIAFQEAKMAKNAAAQAGKIVKIQTVTIELTELIQRLDSLSTDIQFNEVRDLLNEVNRRVKRIISPFRLDEKYKETCEKIVSSLSNIRSSLESVRPIDDDDDSGLSIYYGVEGSFSELSGLLAELTGLLEQRTIEQ